VYAAGSTGDFAATQTTLASVTKGSTPSRQGVEGSPGPQKGPGLPSLWGPPRKSAPTGAVIQLSAVHTFRVLPRDAGSQRSDGAPCRRTTPSRARSGYTGSGSSGRGVVGRVFTSRASGELGVGAPLGALADPSRGRSSALRLVMGITGAGARATAELLRLLECAPGRLSPLSLARQQRWAFLDTVSDYVDRVGYRG